MLHKTLLLSLFLFFFLHSAFAQIQFEKGYIINNHGEKVACRIRNVEWENNPVSIRYMLDDGIVQDAGLNDIREFGIEDGQIYRRAHTRVDMSTTNLAYLSTSRNPEWSEKTVFLKLLINGPASLLSYREKDVRQFYYQKADTVFVPLVYKRYQSSEGTVANAGFRQQLFADLNCGNTEAAALGRVNYTETDLTRYFKQYNLCVDPTFEVVKKTSEREIFNFKVTAGLDYTMLKTMGSARVASGGRTHESTSFRAGVEGEYFAPFNKNKWSLFAEPAFQYYDFPLQIAGLGFSASFWSLEVNTGVRHHFYLSERNRIFVNGTFTIAGFKKKQVKSPHEEALEIRAGSNLGLGAGFVHGRFSGELRYILNRGLITYFPRTDAGYRKASVILAYKFLKR